MSAPEFQTWVEENNVGHLPVVDLGTQHHFSAGVYAKEMHIPKGCVAVTHKHAYDHLSILAQGVAVVTVDGEPKIYKAPACVEIKAGAAHEITAITPIVWFCIHATEETDLSRIDEVLIAS